MRKSILWSMVLIITVGTWAYSQGHSPRDSFVHLRNLLRKIHSLEKENATLKAKIKNLEKGKPTAKESYGHLRKILRENRRLRRENARLKQKDSAPNRTKQGSQGWTLNKIENHLDKDLLLITMIGNQTTASGDLSWFGHREDLSLHIPGHGYIDFSAQGFFPPDHNFRFAYWWMKITYGRQKWTMRWTSNGKINLTISKRGHVSLSSANSQTSIYQGDHVPKHRPWRVSKWRYPKKMYKGKYNQIMSRPPCYQCQRKRHKKHKKHPLQKTKKKEKKKEKELSPPANPFVAKWHGTYRTHVRWGGRRGKWRHPKTLIIKRDGTVIFGGKEVTSYSIKGDNLSWTWKGHSVAASIVFSNRATDHRYWRRKHNQKSFIGWLQNKGEGRLNFRGLRQ